MATIYIPLLNEGVDVWRPVEATLLSGNAYVVNGTVPDDEKWAFDPGSVVYCENRTFSGGEKGLAAIGFADPPPHPG